MKILLYALLVLKIFAAAFLILSLLPSSIIIAIVYGILSLLEIALVVAVIINTDKIEELWYSMSRVRYDIKKIYDSMENVEVDKTSPSIDLRETARGAWDCIKCGTVNKAGSSVCGNCGAEYSSLTNPTADTNQKKRFSRWVK